MKKYIIVTIALLTILNASAQTNYYVDAISGNDLNNGTSLGTAWKTIQKACNTATPNSIVQIKGGTYNENVVVNVNGTIGNPITFKNYMNDIVLIDGASTSGSTMITITNKNYLIFQNFTIQNKTINDAQGLLVETTASNTSTSLTFKNITIKNINWTSSITAIPTPTDNAQGFIAYGRNGGITNLTVDSCQIFNNILGFSEALAINGNVDGFVVKNCKVHTNTNIGIDIIGHEGTCSIVALDEARNGFVSNNECYNNVSAYATSGGIYVDGSKNVTIEKNKCYENGWGIEVGAELNGTVEQITVKNNLIYNNQQAGLSIGGYDPTTTGQVINSVVRNNTFFQNNSLNDGTGEISMTKASNCVFENNVFYTNSQDVFMSVDNISPQAGNVFNYNCWFTPSNDPNNITVNWITSTYSTFSAYQAGTTQETNSIYSNPSLNNSILPTPNLHLQTGSTCIDAGNPATIISIGETDFDGNVRINGSTIDIGGFEFNSALGINNVVINNSSFLVYPNPFIFETTISFNSELKNAKFKIYNILGQGIKEVENIYGRQITINRDNLTEGIYFYKFTKDNKVIAVGKLIAE